MRPRAMRLAAAAIAAAAALSPEIAGAGGGALPGLDAWRTEHLRVVLAAAGAGLLAVGALLARLGRPQGQRYLRDSLLAALGVLGALSWWGSGGLHLTSPYIHVPDMFHYYVGAKYFRELGHTRLYECTVVAEAEEGL